MKRHRDTGPLPGRLRALRKSANLDQHEVASRLGIDSTSVSHWECGWARPNVEHLPTLLRMYSTTIEELVAGVKWPQVKTLLRLRAA